MDGEEAGDEVGDGEGATAFVAPAPQTWMQKSPVERTLIRPGAAGKLEPPPRPRDRGAEAAEGEAGAREAAAAAEAE